MSNLNQSNKHFIFTFGYGNRKTYESLLEYIERYNISYLVDIRLSPRAWSRKWYGESIEKLCASQNIKYLSRVSLGNISGKSYWIPPQQDKADETLSEIAEILQAENVLLLCAEMDCSRCHRVDVAYKLQELSSAIIKHLK